MRREIGSLVLAGVISLAASLAAASPAVPSAAASGGDVSAAPVAVGVNVEDSGLRDEAAMVLIGAMLIALAGAVRRTA